jgi:hypothetical protein
VEARLKALLCGGLSADDAQRLIFEVERGIPASRSKVKINRQVRAFRARLVTETRDVSAKGWVVQFTPEFIAPPVQSPRGNR